MPAPPSAVSGEPGYLMLLRGQTFNGYNSAKHGLLWNYRLLRGRAGDAGTLLFHLIYDRTWSALGCPEWAKITLREFCEYAPHKTDRAIRSTLDFLVKIRLIERDPNDRWRFKTHPENVATAPLRMPVRHPNAAAKKRNARAARMSAPTLVAALRNEPKVQGPSLPQPVESGGAGRTDGPDPEASLTSQSVEFGSLACPAYAEAFQEAQMIGIDFIWDLAVERAVLGWEEPLVYRGRISLRRDPATGAMIPVMVRKFDNHLLMFLLDRFHPAFARVPHCEGSNRNLEERLNAGRRRAAEARQIKPPA